MAENKKSFILYCDVIHTVGHLTDDQAGKLFKHILEYVNDKDPQTQDPVTTIAFEPIKQQLKRDLRAWEETRVDRSKAGRVGGIRSGEARRSKQTKQVLQKRSKTKQTEANEAVNATVTVNVTDTVKRERAFAPPAKEEVCNEMMKTVDDFTAMAQANMFINFYESKGWLVGKVKMKDWKAAARGWISRMSQFKNTRAGPVNDGPEQNLNGHLKKLN